MMVWDLGVPMLSSQFFLHFPFGKRTHGVGDGDGVGVGVGVGGGAAVSSE